jgi:hypothetical protein
MHAPCLIARKNRATVVTSARGLMVHGFGPIRASRPEHAEQQGDDEHDEENEEKNLRNFRRAGCDAREAEHGGDDGDDEEDSSVMKHVSSFMIGRKRSAMLAKRR